jgi:hypothetical protein
VSYLSDYDEIQMAPEHEAIEQMEREKQQEQLDDKIRKGE